MSPSDSDSRSQSRQAECQNLVRAYHAGDAEQCGIAHVNLAAELQQQSTSTALHHLLAGSLLLVRTASRHVEHALNALTTLTLPDRPPTLETVDQAVAVDQGVELPGVEWRSLLRLSSEHSEAGSDELLETVWQVVLRRQQARKMLAESLPAPLVQAAQAGDKRGFLAALQDHQDQAEFILEQLHQAGVISLDMARAMRGLLSSDNDHS